MMSYRDLSLNHSYETGFNDLVNDFYIPVLQSAKRYDRIAGFFSSSALALSARGLAGLIENKGKMRLITCPRLSIQELEVIEASLDKDNSYLSKLLCNELEIEDQFKKDHVAALGWLLSNNVLEMKIALVYEDGKLLDSEKVSSHSIMHQKVGILYDDEWNGISFSGSINESASGWLSNIEEFKVFRSWDEGQKPYFESDRSKFERYWADQYPSVKVKTLPQAVSEKLIEIGKDFDVEKIAIEKYSRYFSTPIQKKKKSKLTLFDYQAKAVEKWISNNKQLLLEMATGCGKTRTAIGCIKNVLSSNDNAILFIVSCPGNTLSVQWKEDIDSLDIEIEKSLICDGTNPKWRTELEKVLGQLRSGYYKNVIIYTTHTTCSTEDFIDRIQQSINRLTTFFIADEVHGMGSREHMRGLLDSYIYRLGLSATPSRWFDPLGTKSIEQYFGNNSFIFSIHDALTTINELTGKPFLVNYNYYPYFVHLTDDELEEYKKLSEKIGKMSGSADEEKRAALEYLLFKRANIEKRAKNKYAELDKILDRIGPDIEDTIIFVSPEQIKTVMQQLAKRSIFAHQFTEKEKSTPTHNGLSERQIIINHFKKGNYKALVAIKCLDEGIDIPSARIAIVMASSTNPREYVQRIGRVIRQAPGKQNAEIYDMIIKPDLSNSFNEKFRSLEKRVFLKEIDRVLELSENALNNTSVINEIYKLKAGIND